MTKEIGADGSIRYHNSDGAFHREDGPALIWAGGTKAWYINDNPHREDGPAVIYSTGIKEWWLNGKRLGFQDYVNKIYPNDCDEKTMFFLKWS